jgi:hypothetical protein
MTTEISKNLMCIVMRGGIEVWIESDKLDPLMGLLETKRFIKVGDQIINTADISGIYEAKTVEDNWYKKNGYWKCKQGNYWHKRNEECGHK